MDRFQLETEITDLATVSDDLVLLAGAVLDGEMSPDDIANALLGLGVLITLRSDKMFDTFKQVFQLDEHAPEAQKHKCCHDV